MGESQCPVCNHVVTGFEQAEFERAAAERNALVAALKDVVRILEAVRFTAGLGKKQMQRLETARALIAKTEGRS